MINKTITLINILEVLLNPAHIQLRSYETRDIALKEFHSFIYITSNLLRLHGLKEQCLCSRKNNTGYFFLKHMISVMKLATLGRSFLTFI